MLLDVVAAVIDRERRSAVDGRTFDGGGAP
jgi:hypothetical protein